MASEKNSTTVYAKKVVNNSAGGAIYGLGIIGAWVYYFQQAHTFSDVIIGIIKGIFWPSVLVFEVFKLLKV